MQPCQRPAPLTPGDRLWVILPSGTLRETEMFEQGIEMWRSRGYDVCLYEDYQARWGYLAGNDQQRRRGLELGLKNSEIKGILCGRGGYGGSRLLEQWQWPNLAPNLEPKWLIGFSDVTSLLWGYAHQGISALHGPVLTTLSQEPDWSLQRLWDWVEGRAIAPLTGHGWGNGVAEGLLLPCNLTVATHLLGTPVAPDLTGVILALEDVAEAPYRIDRMLTQWRMGGYLKSVAGIAVGRFSQCEPPEGVPSFRVEEVLGDRFADLGIPVVSGLPFGHDGENAVLPVGMPAQIDGDRGILSILASGLSV